jgi:hypothetical protein
MAKEEKQLSPYEIRRLGHCKETDNCKGQAYCDCPCLPCKKQDCFKPGCKCDRAHPYKG